MYPPWMTSFDAHIYEGRVLEVILMQGTDVTVAKATMGMSVLAERCKKAKTSGKNEFWVDLQPSGKVQMAVQFFLEDGDVGKTSTTSLKFDFIKLHKYFALFISV